MNGLEYIKNQVSRGRWSFTSREMATTLGFSPKDKLAILRRQRRIISPARGFHVIVPEEYSHAGRLPVDRYIDQLMTFYGLPYYAGLLTAASYYGSMPQSPQTFQVVTIRDKRDILVARNRITFFRKQNMASMPIIKRKTATGYFNLSTPETTLFDLVAFNRRMGGLEQVALVISGMVEQLSSEALEKSAYYYTNAVVQRGAYLLERLNQEECCERLEAYLASHHPIYCYLNPSKNRLRVNRHPRWKLFINETLHLEL